MHLDASNAGANVLLSMYMAPVGHVLVTGQYGFLSHADSSNTTDIVSVAPMAHHLNMVLHGSHTSVHLRWAVRVPLVST